MLILTGCFLTPFFFLILAWTLPQGLARSVAGPAASLGLLFWAHSNQADLLPAQRLLICSLWLLYCLKGWSLLCRSREQTQGASTLGLLLFSYLWPGIDPRPFEVRRETDASGARWFALGFPTMAFGIAGLLLVGLKAEALSSGTRGFLTIGCLLLTVHFGFSDVLASIMRLIGFHVPRLFNAPLLSRSLNDFWTHRWNRPFVDMNRLLFRPLIGRRFGPQMTVVVLFLISGILHELALSFPAGGDWGGPLLYFALQGGLMIAERRFGVEKWGAWPSRIWTWFWLFAPLALLFHQAFRTALILPLIDGLHAWTPLSSSVEFFRWVLMMAAGGHFVVLIASSQVPTRLGWSEELLRLRPLNRKLLWVYGGYIVGMILSLSGLTFYLREEMLAGEKGALAVAALAALFWWSRVIVDAIVFEHSDWPEGPEFVIGHTCLTSLFVTLSSIYTSLLVWCWVK